MSKSFFCVFCLLSFTSHLSRSFREFSPSRTLRSSFPDLTGYVACLVRGRSHKPIGLLRPLVPWSPPPVRKPLFLRPGPMSWVRPSRDSWVRRPAWTPRVDGSDRHQWPWWTSRVRVPGDSDGRRSVTRPLSRPPVPGRLSRRVGPPPSSGRKWDNWTDGVGRGLRRAPSLLLRCFRGVQDGTRGLGVYPTRQVVVRGSPGAEGWTLVS